MMPTIIEELKLDPPTQQVVREAVNYIDERYKKWPYHNLGHTFDVIEASHLIATEYGIIDPTKPAERQHGLNLRQYGNLIIAAAFHDYEHEQEGLGINETESALAAVSAMKKTGEFTGEDYDEVTRMIRSTIAQIARGNIVQYVDENSVLCMILADADLSTLGRPPAEAWERIDNLFREYSPGVKIPSDAYRQFLHLEVQILTKHRWFISEAGILFPHQAENLAYARAQLDPELV